jgi:hypothetical protein
VRPPRATIFATLDESAAARHCFVGYEKGVVRLNGHFLGNGFLLRAGSCCVQKSCCGPVRCPPYSSAGQYCRVGYNSRHESTVIPRQRSDSDSVISYHDVPWHFRPACEILERRRRNCSGRDRWRCNAAVACVCRFQLWGNCTFGESADFLARPQVAPNPPANLTGLPFGIQVNTILSCPEPSVTALGILGLAGLLYRRYRKGGSLSVLSGKGAVTYVAIESDPARRLLVNFSQRDGFSGTT